MTILNRRALLGGLATGLAAPLAPLVARAQPLAGGAAAGFTHNVASGEPAASSVLLWTRYVPRGGGRARVRFEVAADPGFARIVARGAGLAQPSADWCVRVTATGLRPGRRCWYRFLGPDGEVSPVGRTATLPTGRPERFTLAVFSCSNLPFGFFNAYAHAAAREDIDLALHLGDYIYEYPRGTYPSAAETLAGRGIEPAGEIIARADYRARYASYRADPDLQALHAAMPMVSMWDDHELANDAWTGGAQNHQAEREGPWAARRDTAIGAYREWLPVGEALWKTYRIGDLLTLHRLETRISGRDQQLSLADALAGGGDPAAALARFRAGPWADPARGILGGAQEAWLARELARSAGSGVRWQALAQQILMGMYFTPPEAADWLSPTAPPPVRARVLGAVAAGRAGLPGGMDSWGGYPIARARLLRAAQRAQARLVTLAGDSHNGWAFELPGDGGPAGVEFGTTSVSSPGLEGAAPGIDPARIAAGIRAASPELKWCDTSRRGYLTVTFERERVTGRFHLLETTRQRSTAIAAEPAFISERGSGRLLPA